MALLFDYASEYVFETSEEDAVSLLGTVAWGTIVVKHRVHGDRINIKYRCISLGSGKSFPFNVTQSTFDSPSGGDAVVCDRYFSQLCFPCKGYMIGLGGGTSNANSATAVLFGVWPFAGLRMWGTSSALLPGAGVGAGLAGFWVE